MVDGSRSSSKTIVGRNVSGFYALSVTNGATINAEDIHATGGQVGLSVSDGKINLSRSFVTVERGAGISFFSYKQFDLREDTDVVRLLNTKLFVKSGMGILGPFANSKVFLKNSEIDADVLVKNRVREGDNIGTLTLTADHSILKGGTRILKQKDIDEAKARSIRNHNTNRRTQIYIPQSINGEDPTESISSQMTAQRTSRYYQAIQAYQAYYNERSVSFGRLWQKTVLNLNNGSTWILRVSKTETNAQDNMLGSIPTALILDIAQRSRSDISVLNVNDSTIIFESPAQGHYQTLYVGSGDPGTREVYNAGSNTKLYLNTNGRKADRLFIKGNVSGSTTVYVNIHENVSNSANFLFITDSLSLNKRGISLIQVFGNAAENSFKLAKGYMTINGSPYKYTLNAYGPTSRNGIANVSQTLSDINPHNSAFWDFRLQNQYLPNSDVKALLPQMANYLVMPNALFAAGFTDIENQNALLTNIRPMPWEMKDNKKLFFFISSYGNKVTLSSNRTALEYGYDADIGYAAIQTGVALAALEGENTSSYFGLLGTYGKLSFTPQNMADVKKTTFDKWLFTAYSSIQHDSGAYINTFLSYGLFRGNISNAIIGQTARVDDAKTWSASATLGKRLVTSIEDLVFEPQTQIAYQQLMFNTIQDADKFKVDISNPYQWSIRMGGRLVKNVNQFEDGRTLSFYGKLNLVSVFGDGGTVQVCKKSFYFDPIGPAIEGGIGVNAELIQSVTFHGDISYQQKLQKAGLSGAIFSGTLRYHF
ncbi:autotransporter outer membrane beta-barrel domain-containing protein [Bartonella sp. WD12.1]|uniref:autotransporter outer membrane beta-barrel domain-containing protein n=1 Tax=Bartonella sp. WD12.1 TaxID=1933903 RepID=UPI001300F110|nr:autotransporter outer membrane beta-barrel domain-containing protein [Bartonella sp. WD12.1]